jgi:hypothetical protein
MVLLRINMLAAMTLDDVFRSTQDNMNSSPTLQTGLLLLLGVAAVVALLLILQRRLKKQEMPKALNDQGRLLRQVRRGMAVRPAEWRQLKIIADKQDCCSPLVLLLCPSLLAKGMKKSPPRRAE